MDQYQAATSRPEKSEILSSIVSQVRENSADGGFVKQDTATGDWFEVSCNVLPASTLIGRLGGLRSQSSALFVSVIIQVGDFLAREKTSQGEQKTASGDVTLRAPTLSHRPGRFLLYNIAFRDALAEHYRSSKKSKHEKRRQRTQAKAMNEKHGSMLPPLHTASEREGKTSTPAITSL